MLKVSSYEKHFCCWVRLCYSTGIFCGCFICHCWLCQNPRDVLINDHCKLCTLQGFGCSFCCAGIICCFPQRWHWSPQKQQKINKDRKLREQQLNRRWQLRQKQLKLQQQQNSKKPKPVEQSMQKIQHWQIRKWEIQQQNRKKEEQKKKQQDYLKKKHQQRVKRLDEQQYQRDFGDVDPYGVDSYKKSQAMKQYKRQRQVLQNCIIM